MTSQTIRRALIPFGLLLIASSVSAQQAVIDHCKKTSSDTDRIACLEAALLGKPMQEPEPELEPEPEIADVATNPEGIGAEQVVLRNQTREEHEESLEAARGLVVAKYDWVPYERLVVTFENGQVWRQIKGDTNRIRTSLERNQTADITESGLGGYKLRLNEIRRTVRVERIK